jgi:hypothetical protein
MMVTMRARLRFAAVLKISNRLMLALIALSYSSCFFNIGADIPIPSRARGPESPRQYSLQRCIFQGEIIC